MKRSNFYVRFIVLCSLLLLLCPQLTAEETAPQHKQAIVHRIMLVIPNLRPKNVGLKTINDISNAMRTQASQIKTFKLVDHRPLFEKTKEGLQNRDELIALCKETEAELAVLGLFKEKRQLYYLKLELYNLKTDKVENKLVTTLSSLRPMELNSIGRGAINEILSVKEEQK